MNVVPANAVVDRTTSLVDEILSKRGGVRPIRASDSLTDAGISSLDMVNLMLAIEAEFDIFIPPERVNPASFRSIDTISSMVEALRVAAPQTGH